MALPKIDWASTHKKSNTSETRPHMLQRTIATTFFATLGQRNPDLANCLASVTSQRFKKKRRHLCLPTLHQREYIQADNALAK